MADRSVLIGDLGHDVGLYKFGKASGQKILRDPQVFFQLTKASHPTKQIPKNEKYPSIADDVEGALNGTTIGPPGGLNHTLEIRGVGFDLQPTWC